MKKASLVLLLMLCTCAGIAYAGPCPPQYPTSRADGTTAGVPVANGTQYDFKDALLAGFDCFEPLSSWFPSYINSSNSVAGTTVDMAYTEEGTATFSNVVVPTAGDYTLTFRYAFSTGLFPGVQYRPEGLSVNGTMITSDLNFPVTGSFSTYQTVDVRVPLNAGKNTVELVNVAHQGVSRMDTMVVSPGGSANCSVAPPAPTGFSVAEDSNNQIDLNWTGSVAPAGCVVGYYNVYRSTTLPFKPSESNEVGQAVAMNKFVDTTGVCNTPYYYQIQGYDFAGTSPVVGNASPVVISQCPTSGSTQIDAGGGAVAPFVADVDFVGGSVSTNKNAIDLSGVTAPAPLQVYQSSRNGNPTYTLGGFAPGSAHTVRLHFVEPYYSTANSRVFNFSINTTQVSNFDIFVAAGNVKNKAVIHQSTETADQNGNFVITLTPISGKNTPLINAIEIK